MTIETWVDDGPLGVINDAFAYVDDQQSAPQGMIYVYALRTIIASRRTSKIIGIKGVSANQEK